MNYKYYELSITKTMKIFYSLSLEPINEALKGVKESFDNGKILLAGEGLSKAMTLAPTIRRIKMIQDQYETTALELDQSETKIFLDAIFDFQSYSIKKSLFDWIVESEETQSDDFIQAFEPLPLILDQDIETFTVCVDAYRKSKKAIKKNR